MNVFILDRSMEKSAQMLDDAHLKAQINELCQILMANYNHERYPDAKIGHVNHPVTNYCCSCNFTLTFPAKLLKQEALKRWNTRPTASKGYYDNKNRLGQ